MERTLHDELRTFEGREAALQAIPRYNVYKPMLYRTTDAIHARRVGRIARTVAPLVSRRITPFDKTYAEALALVHDDAEIITGDPNAGDKARMNQAELAALEAAEEAAIEELAQRFPKTLGGYNYRELLLAVRRRDTPEAQLVQFADKFDAFGEALHEIMAGNLRFATNVTTEYGVLDTPPVFYVEYFRSFAAKYPALAFLTEGPLRIFSVDFFVVTDWKHLARQGKLHTRDTLIQRTGVVPYDIWKQIHLQNGNLAEIEQLTTRVE